ncbi:MAG: alpha-galactosidase [Anaerolineae bacterium]
MDDYAEVTSAALVCDGVLLPLEEDNWVLHRSPVVLLDSGAEQQRFVGVDDDLALEATIVRETYPDNPVVRQWLEVRNTGNTPVRIDRLDSLTMVADVRDWEALYFDSGWGAEFEPVTVALDGRPLVLDNHAGRSSRTFHPYVTLTDGMRRLTLAVAWSGNWALRFEPDGVRYAISAGLSDWEFHKDLAPGETVVTPAVVLVEGDADLNSTSCALASWGRKYIYPANTLSRTLPVEWNHWWPYEDVEVNEAVFRRNIDAAAAMGVEAVLLDAGWFGAPGLPWYRLRGDWELVNEERFPSGIRALSDYAHAKGIKFGIWCEIEALGEDARLAGERPELAALRDGARLGYVCFGSPEVREWTHDILEHLIVDYNVDWIKLDFNLDPGAGCNRTDHGHGAGDGLFEHYRGYYDVLDRLRRQYPDVVLENCSSGGLRIDLGMAEHTHMTFLSDPDWPVHDLQLFWGATCMLAPDVCLHWSFSHWRGNQDRTPEQQFDPASPKLTRAALDYYTRISMLNWFGYSQRLPDAPEWVQERWAGHVRAYQTRVRRFVRSANLQRLSAQPRRSGGGDRWQGFLYVMPDAQEAALFVFRLPGAAASQDIRLCGLIAERVYTLEDADSGRTWQATGEELMDAGLTFDALPEEGSALIYLS